MKNSHTISFCETDELNEYNMKLYLKPAFNHVKNTNKLCLNEFQQQQIDSEINNVNNVCVCIYLLRLSDQLVRFQHLNIKVNGNLSKHFNSLIVKLSTTKQQRLRCKMRSQHFVQTLYDTCIFVYLLFM